MMFEQKNFLTFFLMSGKNFLPPRSPNIFGENRGLETKICPGPRISLIGPGPEFSEGPGNLGKMFGIVYISLLYVYPK
jgi:hypothetical protein